MPSLSVRTRFEVFKRDRFVCTYCGGHPPDVLLEVDHVVPRAAGGSDEIDNLVTACWNCNRGKSDRLLDEGDRPTVSPKTVAAMEERLTQAKAYVELLGQLSNVTEAMLEHVTDYWAIAFGARAEEREDGTYRVLDGGTWPKAATVRQFLRDLEMDQILGAVDAAASRVGPKPGNDRYFYAICWRLIKDKRAASLPLDESDAQSWRDALDHSERERVKAVMREAQALDEVGELRDQIRDLNITIRRFREETGRE